MGGGGNIFRDDKMKFRVKQRVTNSLVRSVVRLRKTRRRYFADSENTLLHAWHSAEPLIKNIFITVKNFLIINE